jgi:hypothetical protein
VQYAGCEPINEESNKTMKSEATVGRAGSEMNNVALNVDGGETQM